MVLYLLDTNTVSYLADHSSAFHAQTMRRLSGLPEPSKVAISILTLYELTYGASYGRSHSPLLSILDAEQVGLIQLPRSGASIFAEFKHSYRQHTGAREKTLGRHNIDSLLVTTAIVEGAVLVSNDGLFRTLAELEPGLILENWAEVT
jgi:predicted nucleic acid-binding protein